jgi:predicted transcriptional regulator
MAAQGPEAYVAGSMYRDFPKISPEAELSAALPLIEQSCVLVMDRENLLGMVTRENVVEFLMLRRFGLQPGPAPPVWPAAQ